MSSEFSCDYCSAMPRHPCHSRAEAVDCSNNSTPEYDLDLSARHVALWLKANYFIARTPQEEAALALVRDMVEQRG